MNDVITFVQSHAGLLTGIGVALLDLIFALSPAAKSNGILHWLYLTFGGHETP